MPDFLRLDNAIMRCLDNRRGPHPANDRGCKEVATELCEGLRVTPEQLIDKRLQTLRRKKTIVYDQRARRWRINDAVRH